MKSTGFKKSDMITSIPEYLLYEFFINLNLISIVNLTLTSKRFHKAVNDFVKNHKIGLRQIIMSRFPYIQNSFFEQLKFNYRDKQPLSLCIILLKNAFEIYQKRIIENIMENEEQNGPEAEKNSILQHKKFTWYLDWQDLNAAINCLFSLNHNYYCHGGFNFVNYCSISGKTIFEELTREMKEINTDKLMSQPDSFFHFNVYGNNEMKLFNLMFNIQLQAKAARLKNYTDLYSPSISNLEEFRHQFLLKIQTLNVDNSTLSTDNLNFLELYVLSYAYRQFDFFAHLQAAFLKNQHFTPKDNQVFDQILIMCINYNALGLMKWFLDNYLNHDLSFGLFLHMRTTKNIPMFKLILSYFDRIPGKSPKEKLSRIRDLVFKFHHHPLMIIEWIKSGVSIVTLSQNDKLKIIKQLSILGKEKINFFLTQWRNQAKNLPGEACQVDQDILNLLLMVLQTSRGPLPTREDLVILILEASDINLEQELNHPSYAHKTLLEAAAVLPAHRLLSYLVKRGASRINKAYEDISKIIKNPMNIEQLQNLKLSLKLLESHSPIRSQSSSSLVQTPNIFSVNTTLHSRNSLKHKLENPTNFTL